ncbi:MAG: TIGR00341 family protein [Sulfuricurvum sp.]
MKLDEKVVWLYLKTLLSQRLSLTEDKADDLLIDERVRNDVEMKGSNLWILMFAILVASVGLNVNSTAVIIGAMLISPLMGPIMGIGYGAGINDFALIRSAFKNLMIATLIALLTSTLYFLISPLDIVQSELLARTSPTAWDVLIAFFGGLAGIVALTRKEKTNVIPGVAIATALMPPLCTAGFGLATGHWNYFFGAFYLYTINFVFIALSAILVVRAFNISEKKYVDPKIAQKVQRYIVTITILMILPSTYLAYQLVNEEVFKAKATAFVTAELTFKNTNVAQIKIDPKHRTIAVFLIGDHVEQKALLHIQEKLSFEGLEGSKLKVYQNGEREEVDVTTLKADIITDLYQNTKADLAQKSQEITHLHEQIRLLTHDQEIYTTIPNELRILFPSLRDIILSQGSDSYEDNDSSTHPHFILNAHAVKRITHKERDQIQTWLQLRTKSDHVSLYLR